MEMDKEAETGGEQEVGERETERAANTVIVFKLSLLTEHALKR